jgi:hypothetical protein
MTLISKSKYLHGLQCSKLLWYEVNAKEQIPPPSPAVAFSFAEGHRLGLVAQKLFSDLAPRHALFEAGYTFGAAYARADILVPVDNDAWDLIEVKSTTSVKEEHYLDAAFQKYTYEGAGVKIRKVYIMYVNREYLRQGEIDPALLLTKEEITKEATILAGTIEKSLLSFNAIVTGKEPPKVEIGPHCFSPHECPLQPLCWAHIPEKDSVFDLHSGGKKSFDLFGQGIVKLVDIPADTKLNYKQVIQIQAHRLGKPYIDKEAIAEFLQKIKYPLYFLDFETLATALPLYNNLHPYQSVPFQFSLYIVERPDSSPLHHGYLAPGEVDPRLEVLRRLKELLGEQGSVIAYNAQFEQNCLNSAAAAYPEYLPWIKQLNKRFIDLLDPFTKFNFYHPDQQGRASLKYVMPALTTHKYTGLEIAEGGTASARYYKATFEPNVSGEDKARIRQALETYCDLDTLGMIEILKRLQSVTA